MSIISKDLRKILDDLININNNVSKENCVEVHEFQFFSVIFNYSLVKILIFSNLMM